MDSRVSFEPGLHRFGFYRSKVATATRILSDCGPRLR